MGENSIRKYGTEDEMVFIKGLFIGEFIKRPMAYNPEKQIKMYIQQAQRRKEDGLSASINWDKCINFAMSLL